MDDIELIRLNHGTKGEYHALPAGSDKVGRLIWTERQGPDGPVRVAASTQVPPEIGGRGIAAMLVRALVADAREQGFKIDPRCSYVAAMFERHPEWSDLAA